jgi:D-arabinose 1-dehydrogenase-like Zn-dependent alcohol dehydrogenase
LKKIGASIYTRHPILIFGAGGPGLMCLALLKALGGVGAIVIELDPAKRQAALEAGALAAIDKNADDLAQQIMAANRGNAVRAAIDLVGAPSTGAAVFNALAKEGTLVSVGLFGGQSTWSMALIPIKAITIAGSYVGSLGELRELMELVLSKKDLFHTGQPLPALGRERGFGGIKGRENYWVRRVDELRPAHPEFAFIEGRKGLLVRRNAKLQPFPARP